MLCDTGYNLIIMISNTHNGMSEYYIDVKRCSVGVDTTGSR
jgi:hypothetical protein